MKLILQAIKSIIGKLEKLIDTKAAELRLEIARLDSEKIGVQDPVSYGSFRLNPKDGAEIGKNSTAEGRNCTASGAYAHAEGFNCTASGYASHAEGVDCFANGAYSRAAGNGCLASTLGAHAEGEYTVANGQYQHVQGRYNTRSQTKAHIVGNGTSDANRSNAHTLDWEGNAWYAGTLESAGLILTAPGGKRFKITVADDGTLTTSEVS